MQVKNKPCVVYIVIMRFLGNILVVAKQYHRGVEKQLRGGGVAEGLLLDSPHGKV